MSGNHPDAADKTGTDYQVMSVEANEIETRFNAFAGICAWITLAGFITLPNTFTSLQTSEKLAGMRGGKQVQERVRNIPLLPLALFSCAAGLLGTYLLWRKFRTNHIWCVSHLVIPGLSNSIMSLLSTVVNIISTQNGEVSPTAGLAIGFTCALLLGKLRLWAVHQKQIDELKRLHARELAARRIKGRIGAHYLEMGRE